MTEVQQTTHRRPTRILAAEAITALGAIVVITMTAFGAISAQAAGVASGDALLTESDGLKPLAGVIGTQHAFTFKMPLQASCSKDTSTSNYHVFGYIVPSGVDPSTLTFSSAGPSQGFPLVDVTGTGYIAANTAPVTGQVLQPPSLDFFLFSIDGRAAPDGSVATTHTLPAGTYNIGVACATNLGQGDRFWNAQIIITAVPTTTDPNGFTYTVGVATQVTTTTTTSTTTTGNSTTTSTTTSGGGFTTTTNPRGTTTSTGALTGSGNGGSRSGNGSGSRTGNGSGNLAVSGASVMTLSDWALAFIGLGFSAILLAGRRREGDDGRS